MNAAPSICPFDPASATSSAQRSAIRNLVVQPSEPWFSEAERRISRARSMASSRLSPRTGSGSLGRRRTHRPRILQHRGWSARDRPVGLRDHCACASRPRHWLLAAPGGAGRFRGLGGGRMQLATANPGARRLYESCGFRDYSGHIMRYLARPAAGRISTGAISPTWGRRSLAGHWGDSARITMLYTSSHPWFVRDYPSGSTTTPQSRRPVALRSCPR